MGAVLHESIKLLCIIKHKNVMYACAVQHSMAEATYIAIGCLVFELSKLRFR